jgi:hypothetical protein
VGVGRGCAETDVVLTGAAAVEVGGGSAETDVVVAGAAAMEVGGGGAETDVVVAGAAAMEVGGGSAETDVVVAGAAAIDVGGGGAETGVVLAGAADTDAGTSALGGALWDKIRLRPTPMATENRIVRTVPNGVSITLLKFLPQSIFLFTVIVIGGGGVPLDFFCAVSVAA